MASRLKNFERMHPALANPSTCTSQNDLALSEAGRCRAASRLTQNRFSFDEELETSTVYRKAAVTQITISRSSNSSHGPSSWSGLSLSDVNNASTIALPISSRELWNHHRYDPGIAGSATAISWDAWYNPPKKVGLLSMFPSHSRFKIHEHEQKSAFIRTAYFNGQYTNQYSQSKSTGHLIFRRFTISAPNTPPIFTEGAIMQQSPKELEKIGEETSEDENRFELEDTGCAVQNPPSLRDDECQAISEAVSDSEKFYGNIDSDNLVSDTFLDGIPDSCAKFQSRDVLRAKAPGSLAPQLPPSKAPLDKIARFEQQLPIVDRPASRSKDTPSRSLPIPIPQVAASLPHINPVALKRSSEVSVSLHRRCRKPFRSPACSVFCEEEELVFPTRKWKKPLANMGDAVSWKLGVLDRFNAIQY